MKIRGLCVVRNEADIIEQSLRAAAEWCHRIYVLDNGSDDGTWELVQTLSHELPAVVPYKQDTRPFDSGIREEILKHYAAEATAEDWWCILDADEFFIDEPGEFLTRVSRRYQVVWKQDYSYYFTEEDLAAWIRDPSRYSESVPIEERLRYYSADWSEIRFFRHPRGTKTPAIPWHSPATYPRRIRLKHFQYRSPQQIQKRLDTRRAGIESGIFLHENRANWRPGATGDGFVIGPAPAGGVPERWEERVVPTTGLHFDNRDGRYASGKPWVPPAGSEAPSMLRSYLDEARSFISRRARRGLKGLRSLLRAVR